MKLDESLFEDVELKEGFEDDYNNCFVEFRGGKPQFAYNRYSDASRGMLYSKAGDSQYDMGIHEYVIKYLKDGIYYDVDDDGNPVGLDESLTEGKLDNSYKIVEKIKSYVDEGHIDKDELIDKLLQWFYSSPTFLSCIINNDILSEDEVDEIMLSESLTEDIDDVVVIDVPDVIADIKEDELTPSGPAVGEDTGIADLLLNLINGENDTIRDYNTFKANLDSHPEFISVIDDIANEENNHVGMLQTLLKQISPNVETIKQGEAEAEKDLFDDDSQSFEVPDFEVDDSFDDGFGGIYA